mmetsp:Transcript_89308/g.207830  ORF Transcript_89308/g.207830 Transcript_89308/m.207830 type:complete len:223 (-) Transcript_89308:414-1082(-)
MVEGGEVLGNLAQDDTGKEAHDNAGKDAAAFLWLKGLGADDGCGQGEESSRGVEALLHRPHEGAQVHIPAAALLLGGHQAVAEHGADRTHSREAERQRNLGGVPCTQRRGCEHRAHIGLKEVGAHAGHVAHVVSHIVRNDRRVVRVILVNVRLDLADEIRSNVCSLRVDATGHPREERCGGGTEAEATEELQRVCITSQGSEHQEAEGQASQAKAYHEEAHH